MGLRIAGGRMLAMATLMPPPLYDRVVSGRRSAELVLMDSDGFDCLCISSVFCTHVDLMAALLEGAKAERSASNFSSLEDCARGFR